MKELSIEEKAKRYNEALEKARQLCAYPTAKPFISDLQDLFPELKESEDEKVIRDIKVVLGCSAIKFFKEEGKMPIWYDRAVAWLEKQGDNADKVEPKFKTGQWIVWQGKCYKVNYNGCGYELVDQNGLSTSLEYGTINENAHLWDITKDAKDGDVLAGKIDGDSYILIYKQIKDGWIETYGHYYDSVDRFCVPSQLFCREVKGTFYPATKEQRDTLEKAMADAGYRWDKEKLKLEKI